MLNIGNVVDFTYMDFTKTSEMVLHWKPIKLKKMRINIGRV